MQIFSHWKTHWKILSGKCWSFCLCLNVSHRAFIWPLFLVSSRVTTFRKSHPNPHWIIQTNGGGSLKSIVASPVVHGSSLVQMTGVLCQTSVSPMGQPMRYNSLARNKWAYNYKNVSWRLRCLKSPATRSFIVHLIQANNKEIFKDHHYWPFNGGNPPLVGSLYHVACVYIYYDITTYLHFAYVFHHTDTQMTCDVTIKRKCCHIDDIPFIGWARMLRINLITFSTVSKEDFVKITTFSSQWTSPAGSILELTGRHKSFSGWGTYWGKPGQAGLQARWHRRQRSGQFPRGDLKAIHWLGLLARTCPQHIQRWVPTTWGHHYSSITWAS